MLTFETADELRITSNKSIAVMLTNIVLAIVVLNALY
jgi:hypothetical protein